MNLLTVGKIIRKEKKYFVNKKKSTRTVVVFFEEINKLLLEGKEIRFPKKGNGKLFLATVNRSHRSYNTMKVIGSKKGPLSKTVKPVLLNFDVTTVGRVKKDKKFTLQFSYPRKAMLQLQKDMKEDVKRRKLPEIH